MMITKINVRSIKKEEEERNAMFFVLSLRLFISLEKENCKISKNIYERKFLENNISSSILFLLFRKKISLINHKKNNNNNLMNKKSIK